MDSKNSLRDLKLSLVGAHSESLHVALKKRGYSTKLLPTTHFPKMKQIKDTDIIIGAYFQSAWPWFVIGKLRRKKTICHWVGSDSVLSRQNWKRKLQTKLLVKFVDYHIAVSKRIQDELKDMGIESTVLYHGSDVEPESIPFPQKLGVLIHFIEGREKLYGVDRVMQISKQIEDVDFYLVGHFNPDNYSEESKQKNLHFLGYTDISKLWSKISVILRITQHDGFPKIIVEAFSKGRYAIHNYPLPGVILCKTDEEVLAELEKLKKSKKLNEEGLKLFEKEFSYDIFLRNLEDICLSFFNK